MQYGIAGWGRNNFKKPFPHSILSIVITARNHSGDLWYNDYSYGISSYDKNGFSVVGEVNSWSVFYIALGY